MYGDTYFEGGKGYVVDISDNLIVESIVDVAVLKICCGSHNYSAFLKVSFSFLFF